MFYLFLILLFFWLIGDSKKTQKNTMRKIERNIFISDVISGKRKL